jgi:phosphoglycolate phosphatase-like HAD superfamily hydrolase
VLGLPSDITGCLFDLDGVLTQTAEREHGADIVVRDLEELLLAP